MTTCDIAASKNDLVSDAVLSVYERCRIIMIVFVVAAFALSILASLGEHGPEKSSCEPRDVWPFIATVPTSSSILTPGGCPTDPKYVVRR
jgi:hypothetical protein